MSSHYHLCYTLSILNGEGLIGEIDKWDTKLTTIVRIYRPWAIDHRNAMLHG